jgi:hypothetical protein
MLLLSRLADCMPLRCLPECRLAVLSIVLQAMRFAESSSRQHVAYTFRKCRWPCVCSHMERVAAIGEGCGLYRSHPPVSGDYGAGCTCPENWSGWLPLVRATAFADRIHLHQVAVASTWHCATYCLFMVSMHYNAELDCVEHCVLPAGHTPSDLAIVVAIQRRALEEDSFQQCRGLHRSRPVFVDGSLRVLPIHRLLQECLTQLC